MDEAERSRRAAYDPKLWPADHRVFEAFNDAADEVRSRKARGTGTYPAEPTEMEHAHLGRMHRHLRAADKWSDAKSVGADDTTLDLGSIADAELGAIDIRCWKDTVMAVLYAATQSAAHEAMRGHGTVEPNLNQMVVDALRGKLGGLVDAYVKSGSTLPPSQFLHGGFASMQERSDLMGADLAIVVGTRISGMPRYRVVLLQGKHEERAKRNRADVGQNAGRQLDEVLSSGMGYYVFYPRSVQDPQSGAQTRLLPVVRSAEDVFRDVAGGAGKPGMYKVGCYGDRTGRLDATDLSLFVSVAMSGGSTRIGRLFPSAKAVADALSVAGRPVAPDVVAIDSTGRLSCHEFLDTLKGNGFIVHNEFSFPTVEDMKSDPRHGDDGFSR